MKRFFFIPLAILVFMSTGRADDKTPKKESLPQQVSSHVEALSKNVESWQSESENAGRRSRDNVDRRLNQWERQWTDFQEQCRTTWHRLDRGYHDARHAVLRQIAMGKSVWHQMDSFLNSK